MKSLLSLSGQSHTVVRCIVSKSFGRSLGWTCQVLVIWRRNCPQEAQIHWPVFSFINAHPRFSAAWQRCICRSVGLYWDYAQVAVPLLDVLESPDLLHRKLLRGFGDALLDGTIDADCLDPLGLYWIGQKANVVSRICTAVEDFCKWHFKDSGMRDIFKPNPTTYERVIYSAIAVAKQGYSLLGYIQTGRGPASREHFVQLPPGQAQNNILLASPPTFPAAFVEDVLWIGFIRRGRRGDCPDDFLLRDMMIFLLQVNWGLREHEPFHIWVQDVVEDPSHPGEASIFLYHPSKGLAFLEDLDGRPLRSSRQEKLLHTYGLPPRTLGTGSYRVGWKNSLTLTKDNCAPLISLDPLAAQLFFKLYKDYLPQRELLMRRRLALGYGDHPFLFISEQENRAAADGLSSIGAPASIASYERSLARAVARCGLDSTKENGTSSHGPRHLYANTLKRYDEGPIVLQMALRHHHPESQERYGRPSPMQVNEELRAKTQANSDYRGTLQDGDAQNAEFAERYPPYRTRAI
ncbi:hypothetical protein [Paraburkholderia sp. MM5477-R1]|uniref:hypothetical protein n=1 Tax=Paraburkholderia sp. MM5477-R1 TaxID=2991062 RepID=UPI003D2448B3